MKRQPPAPQASDAVRAAVRAKLAGFVAALDELVAASEADLLRNVNRPSRKS